MIDERLRDAEETIVKQQKTMQWQSERYLNLKWIDEDIISKFFMLTMTLLTMIFLLII